MHSTNCTCATSDVQRKQRAPRSCLRDRLFARPGRPDLASECRQGGRREEAAADKARMTAFVMLSGTNDLLGNAEYLLEAHQSG